MEMDRKNIAAVFLCLFFYLGYEVYLNKKYPARFKQPVATEAQKPSESASLPTSTSSSQGALAPVTPPVKALSAEDRILKNSKIEMSFSENGNSIESLKLLEFKNEDQSNVFALIEHPLIVEAGFKNVPSVFLSAERDGTLLRFVHRHGDWLLTKIYSLSQENYGLGIEFQWAHESQTALPLSSQVSFSEEIDFYKSPYAFLPGVPSGRPAIAISRTGKPEWLDVEKSCGEDSPAILRERDASLDFLGFDKHYFAMTLLPQSKKLDLEVTREQFTKGKSCLVKQAMSLDQGLIPPGQVVSLKFNVWAGPKNSHLMEAFDSKLENAVDLGFFAMISKALLKALAFIYSLLGNWGVAIILFTIFLKMLFYPLTRQAAVSMKKMQKFQPEMNRIREKHKDDPKIQQQELMRFMSMHKINPMKGCLPILPQIPVFIAFFRVLSTSIEIRQAPFFGWIHDLSIADPFFVTPVLFGLVSLLQQRLTPTTGLDKTQERIMMVVPIFFAAMSLTFPAGLVLYMLANSLMSIAQQQWLNRRLI